MRGPQEQTKSIYLFPSTSQIFEPFAFWIKRGEPPTALNARTGEFTPPGRSLLALSNSRVDLSLFNLLRIEQGYEATADTSSA
jgi:hypothetical protein